MRSLVVTVALLECIACASSQSAAPVTTETTQSLRDRMNRARSTLTSYVGEARLTYFGPQGRVKGTATLA
ncbi:MAG: hypothetical protein AAF658_19920, partial [Myxococcota bacterium]